MITEGGRVEGLSMNEMPKPNDTIADDFDVPELKKVVKKIVVWFRDKNACPFGRGNWIVDIHTNEERLLPALSLKLPKQMTREQVINWLSPLKEFIK